MSDFLVRLLIFCADLTSCVFSQANRLARRPRGMSLVAEIRSVPDTEALELALSTADWVVTTSVAGWTDL